MSVQTPPPVPQTERQTAWLFPWGLVAALVGLGCLVLPSYLPPGPKAPPYGHPLIEWFAIAFANLRPVPTLLSFFVLGLVLGAAQPKSWRLLSCLAMSLPLAINAINIVHDCMIDPTDHNLWPFEFVILGLLCCPVILGGLIGSRLALFRSAN